LRALERFIGRGIVRKRAEGFNYTAAAPAKVTADQSQRYPLPGRAHPKPVTERLNGGNPQSRHGFRPASARRRKRWRTNF
jgi:ATP-dependent RNA helicase RhlE